MRIAPFEVVGAGGKVRMVKPGDDWPAPYIGSRYTVRGSGQGRFVGWKKDPQRMRAEPYPSRLADHVRAVKLGKNGSFCVTAHRAVVAKVDSSSGWTARYVGVYEDDLQFPGVDARPSGLQLGMYWTGFPFAHGERWVVSPYADSNHRLHWTRTGRTFYSTGRHPELIETCLSVRPRGGDVYISESGGIWMNVPDGGLSPQYRSRFQQLQREQVDALQASGSAAQLRLLHRRVKEVGVRPIYVGAVQDFDDGVPPWTLFGVEDKQQDHTLEQPE